MQASHKMAVTLAALSIGISGCGGGGGGGSDTNMPPDPQGPSLALINEVVNDNGGTAVAGDWTLTAAGYNAASPMAGTYELTASGPAGYTQTSLTCSNSGDTEVTSVTLSAGQSVTCTFVNDDDAPSLTLTGEVTNDNGGTAAAADWTLTATGYDAASPAAGTYSLTASGPAGYLRTSLTCDNAQGQVNSVTLGLGEAVTCAFVHDDEAPSLTLVTQVINDSGGTAVPADWTLSATGYDSASPVTGTYELTASGPAGYTQTSLTCSNAIGQVSSVTLGLGDNITCTFVNDDNAINVNIDNPTLTVADNQPVTGASGLELVWSDEFNGDRLDPEVWLFERGDGSQYGIPGWGNNELQYYLEDSAQLEDGLLVITARRQSVGGKQYTSARINTRDRFAFRYGRIEASIRLPGGQGIWPAFWMLPQDNAYGGWAASGEIDIVEAVNLGASGGNTVHGTIHFGGAWPNNTSRGNSYPVPEDATQVFHTYALEWDETELRWYVDDQLYGVQTATWSSTGGAFPAPFDQPFYILFNTAVGGNWPGSPNSSTEFPVTMEVDWVRVYSGTP